MEDGTWRGKEREWEKRRGGETVSRVWMNSNENRGSNVPFLCRMGIDSLPLLQSNRALCPRPQLVQSQNKTIEQRQKEIDWHSKLNQRNIWELPARYLQKDKKNSDLFLHFCISPYIDINTTHKPHIRKDYLTHCPQMHQSTSRVTLTAAAGTEVQDNHPCFLFFWKWNYVKGINVGRAKHKRIPKAHANLNLCAHKNTETFKNLQSTVKTRGRTQHGSARHRAFN